jgi:hypothetical protein
MFFITMFFIGQSKPAAIAVACLLAIAVACLLAIAVACLLAIAAACLLVGESRRRS